MAKRVWILGAGFSRSLGAPLLNDLLSFRLRSRLVHDGFEPFDLVYALYHYGMDFPEGYAFAPGMQVPKGERGCWHDAEDFLEFLDQCVLDRAAGDARIEGIRMRMAESCRYCVDLEPKLLEVSKTLVGRLIEGNDSYYSADHLQTAAKRIIAAEVCEFLQRPSKERLTPYIKWLKQLGEEDTIITFNYDCLLEKLVKDENPLGHLSLYVSGVEGNRPKGAPELLKLHGSVDWKRIPEERFQNERLPIPFERSGDFKYAIENPQDGQILTPGGSKLNVPENELQPLWGTASERIRQADKVYFLGYRIPESDASAREMILNALPRAALTPLALTGPGAFTGGSIPKVPVKIVLGAAPHHDRDRLEALLEMVGAAPEDSKLWAQDFLAAWNPERH